MIKRTLYFGNPAYLGFSNGQLVVKLPVIEKNDTLPENFKKDNHITIPVEDIGTVIIDHQQITLTQALLAALVEKNASVIICNDRHHPEGLFLPLDVHHIQQERFSAQIASSLPFKKQLWQQTVEMKIRNQAALLSKLGKDPERLLMMSRKVRSGDPENQEGRAAHFYWGELFQSLPFFSRGRTGEPPNNLLNYGYAILRAAMARSLVGSGLLPTLGIHHSNKYNAFCLADDIMEPYRPFVDEIVHSIVVEEKDYTDLSPELKKKLLQLYTRDVHFDEEKSPLMVGMQRSTASLAQCFEGKRRKITYPSFI